MFDAGKLINNRLVRFKTNFFCNRPQILFESRPTLQDTRTLIVKELFNVEMSYVESLQFLMTVSIIYLPFIMFVTNLI